MTATLGEQGAARIPLLEPEDMTEAQRALYNDVVTGPRGRMIGPLRAVIHSPDLAARWSRLGEFLRYSTSLPQHLNELAIMVCGRRWSAQIEWWVHARVAAECGIPEHVIASIRELQPPLLEDVEQWEVYEFTRALQQSGRVPPDLHDRVHRRWGTRGVVELTAVIGYYTMVAMTLNAHDMPVPDGSQPLPSADTLVILPPARPA